MANNYHTIGSSLGTYILLAVIVGVLAFLGVLAKQPDFTATLLLAALIAALTAAFSQYASTGGIAGTAIPWQTLIVWGVAALLAALEYVFGQTTYTVQTFIAAGAVFAAYLLAEVRGSASPIPAPSPPSG